MPAPAVFPRLSLRARDGGSQPVVDAAVPLTLVAIGHSECGTTRLLVPYLARLWATRGPGSSVVLVLQDDAPAAQAFLEDLGVDLPVLLEAEPYRLAQALELTTVPTLYLVTADGAIETRTEGFQRQAVEDLAARLEAQAPFFLPTDKAPALRPG